MSNSFVSKFTPSLMTPETLEALFVQRQALADQVLDDIRHSVKSKAKHYNLLIGPRGFGKTHFVAIIHNRILADEALKDKLLMAWLREEERGVSSFLELLMRVLLALARQYPDSGLEQQIQGLYDLSRKEGERAAAQLLIKFVGKRTLLLIIENLDSIFVGLKDVGQQALRAFLQEHPICTILATSTALFSGVSLQTSVFYGFFHIHHLDELSLDEAIGLLASIAQVKGDTELASFIHTPTGRARIRAVDHLAGGNHRVYVIFSEFLTRASLDELVTPFMRMLDDLTPYYQGRMDLLSAQQQQIVELLAHAGAPRTVKEIARRSFMTPQTAANQLKDLKEKGYLIGTTPQSDKRETYYELREPLMRLCFEVKEYRGGPIRLFVDFLRLWYSKDELARRLEIAPLTCGIERACLQRALEMLETDSEDPRVKACIADMEEYRGAKDYVHCLQIGEELTAIRGSKEDWTGYGVLADATGRREEALNAFDRAISLDQGWGDAKCLKGRVLVQLRRYKEALAVLDSVGQPVPEGLELTWSYARANALLSLGREEESLCAVDQAIDVFPADGYLRALRVRVLCCLGRKDEALQSYEKAAVLFHGDEAIAEQIAAFSLLGRKDEAAALLNAHSHLLEDARWARDMRIVRGSWLLDQGKHAAALAVFDEVIRNQGEDAGLLTCRAAALLALARLDEALKACKQVVASGDKKAAKVLAGIIVSTIPVLTQPSVDAALRHRWLVGWQELAEGHEQLQVTVLLLDVATRYLDTGDDRVLLELPVELREMVRSLLGFGEE